MSYHTTVKEPRSVCCWASSEPIITCSFSIKISLDLMIVMSTVSLSQLAYPDLEFEQFPLHTQEPVIKLLHHCRFFWGEFLSLEANHRLEDEQQLTGCQKAKSYKISAKMLYYKISIFTDPNDWHLKCAVLGGKWVCISVFTQYRSLVIRAAWLIYHRMSTIPCINNSASTMTRLRDQDIVSEKRIVF